MAEVTTGDRPLSTRTGTTGGSYSEPTDLLPDVAGVKSRVSWPAIFGGALTALSAYLVLTLLLAAVGFTIADQDVQVRRGDIWVTTSIITSIVVSLFLGGWVASQLTVGENRQEAIIYGILTWAVVTGLSLYLVAAGVRAGYFGLLGGSLVAQNSSQTPTVEELGARLGYSPERIQQMKNEAAEQIKAKANDPATGQKAENVAAKSSWAALVGVMLSMAASIGGALAGVGTQFRLFPVDVTGGRRMTTTGTSAM